MGVFEAAAIIGKHWKTPQTKARIPYVVDDE
jgi:hypothetical protein